MRTRLMLRLAACATLLAACQPGGIAIKPTTIVLEQSSYCALDVEGPRLLTDGNRALALFGADLPSIAEMEKSGPDPAARLRALAQEGARIVRVPIIEGEFTSTYPALKLAPFIKTANGLGMVVVLANEASLAQYNNDQYDSAEEWLRDVGKYFGTNSGVWFEPITHIKTISPLRRKNIWQRLTDITRGYRHVNVILVTEPVFLNENDAELQRGVIGPNVVYAPRFGELRPDVLARVPHVLLGFDGREPGGAIGAITSADAGRHGALWRMSKAC